MREIKFRAWDTKNNLMSPVGGIDFKDGDKPRALIYQPVMTNDGVDWDADTVDHIELMQYTGLKDKNGKEIYEGDIIKVWGRDDYLETIVFEHGSFVAKDYDQKVGDGTGGSLWQNKKHTEEECEVIGNIYENPELLEK
jgi:uncharacterized phage protein (TIGR01671 family)